METRARTLEAMEYEMGYNDALDRCIMIVENMVRGYTEDITDKINAYRKD